MSLCVAHELDGIIHEVNISSVARVDQRDEENKGSWFGGRFVRRREENNRISKEFDQEQHVRLTHWLFRFALVNTIMTDKQMKMEEIRRNINEAYGNGLQYIATDDNADELASNGSEDG